MALCRVRRGPGPTGLALLALDAPGSGEALREHGLTFEVESEKVAAAALERLRRQPDVDPARIGVYGISMGAYSAVRAACMEPRIAACAVNGAFFSFIEVGQMYLERLRSGSNAASSPQMRYHLQQVFGIDMSDSDAVAARLGPMDLGPVIAKLACPLLVLHSADDRQVPANHGRRTVDGAANCSDRTLVEFPSGEVGAQHCSIDNYPRAANMIQDWLVRTLHTA